MALSIDKAIFVKRAPFEHLEIEFKEKGINVLSAINGKGKTTVLSHIVDAFYEMARPNFSSSFEGREYKLYRISSSIFNTNSSDYSIVYLRFKEEGETFDYVDIRGSITEDTYKKELKLDNIIPFSAIKNSLEKDQYVKYFNKSLNERVISIFNNNILTYFPSYRYEQPYYLNKSYQVDTKFNMETNYSGCLPNPIEVTTEINYLANWIMDVVLDWYVNRKEQEVELSPGKKAKIDATPEKLTFHHLNKILSLTLSSKILDQQVRFGIGKRNDGKQRVAIMRDSQSNVFCISPSIFCLSSGELALLGLFGEILRQGDKLQSNIRPEDIKGIVLIDEIDLHLHIKLQKEILPELFNRFPNIQFIVSSHSPFLNMGLADKAIERSQIIDLDNKGLVCEPTNNDLYKEVYDMMISENQNFAEKFSQLSEKIKEISKPIIITEGKTDWKHIKAALNHFKELHQFEDIDVEIFEYEEDFGDSKLNGLLNQYKALPPRYKVFGFFDCDEGNGKDISNSGGMKKYCDNVWGVSIPIPSYREYNKRGISIEFLYKDEDLLCKDEQGRRLYKSSEFNENGRLKTDLTISVKNFHDIKNNLCAEQEKIQAKDIVDQDGNSLALSKEDFATNILDKRGSFSNVDFEGFKPLFERLQSILNS